MNDKKGSDCCVSQKDNLLSYDEALQRILAHCQSQEKSEPLGLLSAVDRVLAEAVLSTINVPPHNNSAMDGYAARCQDIQESGTELLLSQRICAGQTADMLAPGTAARIFTGAPVPENADAVIMQEKCEALESSVRINQIPEPGQNIRLAGEDIRVDQEILFKGQRLRAQEIGLAASVGCAQLNVFKKLKIALLFTGDELTEPGQPLEPGKIYDSNRFVLTSLLHQLGCEVVDSGLVADTLEETKNALNKAAAQADLIISCGGVSVGEEDHVRIAMEQYGKLDLWRIAIKPGKPLAFGEINSVPFFGLPGNPVSAFVTFLLFTIPYIKKMQGQEKIMAQPMTITADFNWSKAGVRMEFVRARLSNDNNQQARANIFPHQGSGVLTSTSWADGLIIIPIGKTIKKGDLVEYLSFKDFL
ncbi:MAG: molybdopterin molybdotransferase MoeA [Gammaproteobacteria bacterium]|nr:molybdopterin molybdotransferase MoeA [Gammaproteobacteria bacterium]